ncbi:acyl carrier protein [Streptomyces narbonensis]
MVVGLDPARYAEQNAGHARAALVAELTGPAPAAERAEADNAEPAGWITDRLRGTDEEEREHELRTAVRSLVARMLGSDDGLPADGSADAEGFSELGLDSIMAIDLRSALAHAMGKDLPATVAIDHPSVLSMSEFLLAEDAGSPAALAATPAPATTPVSALVPSTADTPQAGPSSEELDELSLDDLLAAVHDDLSQER